MKHIEKFIEERETWQCNKGEIIKVLRFLQPLPFPHRLWHDISMNFIGYAHIHYIPNIDQIQWLDVSKYVLEHTLY